MNTREEERPPSARWLGAVGVLFSLGGILGVLSPALDMPASDADVAAFADHYEENRTELLVLAYLNTLAMSVIAAVFVALQQRLRGAEPILGGVGLAAGILTLVMTVNGFILFAAAAYREVGADAARDATDLGWMFINVAAGPPSAVSIGAFTWGLVRSGQVGRWLAFVGAPVAMAHLVVAAAFADHGFLSPTGGIAYLVPCLWFGWIACASVSLLRPRGEGGY